MTLNDYTNAGMSGRVDQLIQDKAGKLSSADRASFVGKAIVQRYSKDRPREMVTDVSGQGTGQLPLPAPDGGPVYEEGFSEIRQLEYPLGEVPPSLVQNYEWDFYRTPAGLVLLFSAITPSDEEQVRVSWTARHAPDASTVPDCDFDAVADLAAAYCLEALAAIYAQTGDNSIAADMVNYRSKGQEYAALAKLARKRYYAHLGIPEDATDHNLQGPAVSLGDMDNLMGPNVERMTHRRPR
jgi:hypothetical protein